MFGLGSPKAKQLNFNFDDMAWPELKTSEKTIYKDVELDHEPRFPTSNAPVPEEHDAEFYRIFLVLQDYLQPTSSLSLYDTVDRILDIYPNEIYNLQAFTHVCLFLAEQIPYSHTASLKLARLICQVGINSDRVKRSKLDGSKAMHMYYQELNEVMLDTIGEPGDEDDDDGRKWVNIQAVLAHCQAHGLWIGEPGPVARAIYKLPDASTAKPPECEEARVMGAALWIVWNGQILYELSICPVGHPDGYDITPSVWKSWKKSFQTYSTSKKVGKECRDLAAKAARMMEALEENTAF